MKIFRNVRQKLAAENLPAGQAGNVAKYLRYAIGEIVLVVIGILIALQVNNWNEGRKEKATINNYLKSMLVDLNKDTQRFNVMIKSFNKQIKTNSFILVNKEYQKSPIDTIALKISSFFTDYNINDQTYQKIKNSGLADQIGSSQLNDRINSYYTTSLYTFNLFIDYDQKRTLKDDEFWFLSNDYEINVRYDSGQIMNFPFSEGEAKRKSALIKKIESNIGRNTLRNNITRKSLGLEIVKKRKNEAKLLTEMINTKLNHK